MGRWAQYRKRGRSRGDETVLFAPVIVKNIFNEVFWSVDGPTPYNCSIEVDDGGGFTQVFLVGWGDASQDMSDYIGDQCRVIGQDIDGNPVTLYSNTLTI